MDGISESHKKENFTNMEILTRTYFIVAGWSMKWEWRHKMVDLYTFWAGRIPWSCSLGTSSH
jgi:hypothetical protein